ncbi:hypothetical protein NFI96_018694 [Prochilodus magdalenae]|nr:hypothetical protein NFI96_018694 [Prochilodus magdalenae]
MLTNLLESDDIATKQKHDGNIGHNFRNEVGYWVQCLKQIERARMLVYLVAQHALLAAGFCRHRSLTRQWRSALQQRQDAAREERGRCVPEVVEVSVKHQSTRDRHVPPMEDKVHCSRVSLPVLNLDRLRTAKALVEKAVKERKVFSIEGPYPVIRAALRARGWVERRLPRRSPRGCCHGGQEGEGTEETDSSDDDGVDRGQNGDREDDTDDMSDLMSRLVRHETTYFYWTTRRDTVDCSSLRKDQMTNHYAKAGSFTTKVGLCMSLKNLQWFDSTDPDTFFPRCYRLGAEDEKHAFIEDFRRTACTSLLRYVVERAGGGEVEGMGEICNANEIQVDVNKQYKLLPKQKLGAGLIDTALRVCQEYLSSREHNDIDVESPSSLSEQQWADFIQNYYLIIHDGVIIEGCSEYAERCRSMLTCMHKVCPQLETDGLSNIWIIKPGAQSRGRGIVCMNRLDEMLSLVDSEPALIKDSKWVVQKYLERPLLVHGTKFDLRQWFLVTDWNPLTVWFYDECYLRFSTQPYSTHQLDSSIHLCNNSIQKHFRPCAGRDPSLPAENMWSCAEFRSWLAASARDRLWEEVVLPGMRRAVIQTLLTAQDSVEPRKASFELYGADFILGCDLHPWLLEVNVSPTMAPSTVVTARLCAAVQEDTLRVVLDRRYDRSMHTGGFQLIYKQQVDTKAQDQCNNVVEADIVFLVDGSSSIGHDNFVLVKNFMAGIVKPFAKEVGPSGIHFGAVQYSDTARVEFTFTTYLNGTELVSAIENLNYKGGNTRTGAGLKYIADNFFNPATTRDVPKIAILITDGKSQDNVQEPSQKLRGLGVTIFAVGIKSADQNELTVTASPPQSEFTSFIGNFRALSSLLPQETVSTQQQNYVARELRSGTDYLVSVIAQYPNSVGEAVSAKARTRSLPGVATLRLIQAGFFTLSLAWDAPTGPIQGYRITYGPRGQPAAQLREQTVGVEATSLKLDGLEADTEYVINLYPLFPRNDAAPITLNART